MGTDYIEMEKMKIVILRENFLDTICRMILDTEKGFDIRELGRIELALRLRNYKKNKDNESEQKQDENTNSL